MSSPVFQALPTPHGSAISSTLSSAHDTITLGVERYFFFLAIRPGLMASISRISSSLSFTLLHFVVSAILPFVFAPELSIVAPSQYVNRTLIVH